MCESADAAIYNERELAGHEQGAIPECSICPSIGSEAF